jgi:Glycosyltransferase family 87
MMAPPMQARLWLLFSMLTCSIAYFYTSRILLPSEHYINVEKGTLKAEMGDLYPSWLAARELFLHHRNPYGPEVTHEIQLAFYGRIIDQNYDVPGATLIDEQRFAYPIYLLLLLAPIIHTDFAVIQAWTPLFFAIITAVSILLWLDILRWRPRPVVTVALIFFILSTPQIGQGLRLRQPAMLVAFLLALGTWCVVRNHLASAGIVLALATVKPHMIILPIAWLIFWSVGSWHRRRSFLVAFAITVSVLIGVGELIFPGWPRYFLSGLLAYRHYSPTISLLDLVFGCLIGTVLALIAIIAMLAWAWQNRREEPGSYCFIYILLLLCTLNTLVLRMTPYNQILLLLPVLVILRNWGALSRAARTAFAVIVSWSWITSLILLAVHSRLSSPQRLALLPSLLSLAFPFLAAVLATAAPIRTVALDPNAQWIPLRSPKCD